MNKKSAITGILVTIGVGLVGYFMTQGRWEKADAITQDAPAFSGEYAGTGMQETSLPAMTKEEAAQGWYWGAKDQQKPGTPAYWMHKNKGTRSAMWYDPSR